MKKLALLFLLSITVQAQVIFPDGDLYLGIENANKEDEAFPPAKLNKRGKEEIDELKKFNQISSHIKRNNKKRFKYEKSNNLLKPFQAVLIKDATVFNLLKEKSYKVPNAIYVKAELTHIGSQYSYIFNKNDEVIFVTKSSNLSSIEEITNLSLPHNPKKNYLLKEDEASLDYYYTIDQTILFEQETREVSYLYENTTGLESDSLTALGFRYKAYFQTGIPLDVGFFANAQEVKFQESLSRWTSIFLGATVRYNYQFNDSITFRPFIDAGKSIYDQLSIEGEESPYSFSTNYWSLGVHLDYKTALGNFLIGISRKNYLSSLKNYSERDLNFSSEKKSSSSLGFSIGYKFEVEL